MKGPFVAMHARALCHATEDVDRVKQALVNAIGPADVRVSRTEGHHGNLIFILEALVEDGDSVQRFFERLRREDLEEILASLSSRIDEKCNMYIRLDKQSSFSGAVKLGENDDVISVRVRLRAFPAKVEVASRMVEEHIGQLLSSSGG
jgi:RNA binding exosome subunit